MTDRAPTSIPGPDPLDRASQWLNFYQACDLKCTENHPVNHSTVTGLHAAAVTARIAGAEYKRERNEALSLLRELTEATPCRLDHNGFCQEHLSGSPCAHRRANELLARLDPGEAG